MQEQRIHPYRRFELLPGRCIKQYNSQLLIDNRRCDTAVISLLLLLCCTA